MGIKAEIKKLGGQLPQIFDSILKDPRILSYYRLGDFMATYEYKTTPHDLNHAKRAAYYALSIYDHLHSRKIKSDIVKAKIVDLKEAEAIVLMAAMMHDIGNTVDREKHPTYSVFLAEPVISDLLGEYFPERKAVMYPMVLHAINAHSSRGIPPETLEANCVALGDRCDVSHKRIREDYHVKRFKSLVDETIENIDINSKVTPLTIDVYMDDPLAIFRVERIIKEINTRCFMVKKYATVRGFLKEKGKMKLFEKWQPSL
jgi:metal-dependent HD superfamily phosphatase/phosphodiesterase